MFIDARHLEDRSETRCEVCIIGAGAAGISVARKLRGRGFKVCVLEGGGLDPDTKSQALYDGEICGHPYFALDSCRVRCFGGTTDQWAGYCWPMQPPTFDERPWIPYSGWPIGQSDLAPYHDEAAELLGFPRKGWSPEAGWELSEWENTFGEYRVPFSTEYFRQLSTLVNPLRMGVVFRNDFARAGNVDVFLRANAVELEATQAGNLVRRCRVQTLEARTLYFTARYFVLAAGGIENPRLLLLSDRVHREGLGNRNDLVGRFFTDHATVPIGAIQVAEPDAPFELYIRYKNRPALGEIDHVVTILATEAAQAEFELVPIWIRLLPKLEEFWRSKGPLSLKEIRLSLSNRTFPGDFYGHIRNVLTDLGSVARLFHARAAYDGHSYEGIDVQAGFAPAPNRDSRIMLSEAIDALGLRKAKLDWRLSEIDYRSIVWLSKRFALEVDTTGFGRMKIALGDDLSWTEQIRGNRHHVGTTRMGVAPQDGVVDRNCRVFGVDNLYITGSSVFPTSGAGAPTLTIIALAHRLADHLSTLLAS